MTAKLVNAVLQALPVAGVCMKGAELARATGFSAAEVSATCTKLISRRLVERVRPGCFRLTEAGRAARAAGARIENGRPKGSADIGIRKARPNTLRARLWKALRACRKATVGDLLELVRDGSAADDPRDAQRYLAALAAAGIVRRMPRRGAGGEHRYLLLDDPGATAPVYRRGRKQVFEPNSGRLIDLPAAGAPRAPDQYEGGSAAGAADPMEGGSAAGGAAS